VIDVIIATDLEGVLIPEIWIEVAEEYGIDELKKTTRDIPDFEELMDYRIDVLQREGLTISDLRKVGRNVMAYPGSHEFLSWCRRQGQVMIISDTFHEISDELIWDMGGYNLFANRFIVGEDGIIEGYRLRIRGMKWNVLEKLRDIGFFIVAIGDSYNDISMLEEADYPIMYNPPEELVEKYPNFQVHDSYEDIRRSILTVSEDHKAQP